MNYSDQILENKTFKFLKQLMYNFAVAICIMLLVVLLLVYGFNFGLYNVESDSQAPYYYENDMVVVVPQKKYKVGDIIKFDETDNGALPTTHRLVYILEEGGVTYYLCHGDANANLDGTATDNKWEDDYQYIKKRVEIDGANLAALKTEFGGDVQTPIFSQIEGKVIGSVSNIGSFFKFMKTHYLLFIAIVTGIWCVSYTVQCELEMRRCLRLL